MTIPNPTEWLCLKRTVRFGETDAAGVIHFSQLLRWCHEAWEESLQNYGISASSVFPKNNSTQFTPEVALPIVHCEADYFEPIYVGDTLDLKLSPQKLDFCSFLFKVRFYRGGLNVAMGQLRHISINVETRKRSQLSRSIDLWLEASSEFLEIKSL